MSATTSDSIGSESIGDPFVELEAKEAAGSARASEWRDLVADVEDLIKKIADVSDVEIARVRERLKKTLSAAKESAALGARAARTYTREASVATGEYVRQRPWTAVGVAAAVGILIGVVASRR